MIKFCLSFYECSQVEKDEMLNSLKMLGFAIDDYGSLAFVKYIGEKINAIVNSDSFTGKLHIAIFEDPKDTLLVIPQERISCIYFL